MGIGSRQVTKRENGTKLVEIACEFTGCSIVFEKESRTYEGEKELLFLK